ncbi:MAG: flavodoxin family protein [Parabacteroides sp.]|nr:flavodoxin family protein [Parabacteroides sp.]
MKVLLINGSPRKNGNTGLALSEVAGALNAQGVETETISIGAKAVQGCIACNRCAELGRCIFQDELYNAVLDKLEAGIDGLVIGSPTYYAGPNGSLCALLDRLFYSASSRMKYKPAAAVAVCRRGGASATLDRLNKYFTINHMPVVPSQYWNIAHGLAPGDVLQDAEGLQTMRTLGKNMAWLLKALAHGGKYPDAEPVIRTNFIR